MSPWWSLYLFQYFARNWPWYGLRGLHICITWFSLYGTRIPLFSLYGIHMPLLPYMVRQPIVLGMTLLWAAMDSSLSQRPLLWRHSDMTVIVSWNTPGRERDTRQRLDKAITLLVRLLIDRIFVGLKAICYVFLMNNSIYIVGRNSSFSTAPVLLIITWYDGFLLSVRCISAPGTILLALWFVYTASIVLTSPHQNHYETQMRS